MTEATASPTTDDTSPLEPIRLLDLFARPARFFAPGHALGRQPELFLVVFLAGIAKVQERLDLQLSKATLGATSPSSLTNLATSWTSTWLLLLIAGLIAAGLGWLIGGWWYGVRLHLSGAPNGHEREARLTWAYVTLVTSLPAFIYVLVATVRYDSYYDNYHAPVNPLDFLLLGITFWSVWVSYQAATTRFRLEAGKARLWFLILPLALYVVVLVIFGTLGAMLGIGSDAVTA